MLKDLLISSTIETVLLIRKNFLPGPSVRSSTLEWSERNNIKETNNNNNNNNNRNPNKMENIIVVDDDENDNHRTNLSRNNSYSYILSASIDDHYDKNHFFMFPSNQTMFFSSSFDSQHSNPTDFFSPTLSTTMNMTTSMFIPTLIGFILFTITIWTIVGNIFVILAFLLDKQIRQGGMSNYLIINLAVSDLLLGVAVLPFSASYSTFGVWYFGKFLCEFWLAIDVLCSTASIWGLLMIAFDRYIATNYPIRYRHHRHSIRLALSYICVAWFVSLAICLLPTLFVEKKISIFVEKENRTILSSPTKYSASNRQCELYKDLNFVLTSSLLSFYIPLIIMIFLYVKVFYAIRQQSIKMNKKCLPTPLINKTRQQAPPSTTTTTNETTTNMMKMRTTTTTTTTGEMSLCPNSFVFVDETCKSKSLFRCCLKSNDRRMERDLQENLSLQKNSSRKYFRKKKKQLESCSQNSLNVEDYPVNDQQQLGRRELTAEARVTRSLAIVIGCFVSCWLPFFTLYIIRAVCLCLSFNAIEFFVWLGYSNSSINPVLYAILNKNFRLAFKNVFVSMKKILFFR